MNHETWKIPAEHRRSGLLQTLDDLRFTLALFFRYLVGPFLPSPRALVEGSDPSRPPVIIVPGFICRPANYLPMQRAFHAAGYACHIMDLGYQVGCIYRKAKLLSEYITAIGANEVYVVAHSMGGLVLATSLHQGERRVRHAWTLGTPLWGTNIVHVVYGVAILVLLGNLDTGWGWYLVAAVFFMSTALRQMLPDSDLITFVSAKYGEMQNVTSVFCTMDTIVFSNPLKEPGSSSRFGRESDVLFPEAGHNNIAMGDNAIRAMVQAVNAEQARPVLSAA